MRVVGGRFKGRRLRRFENDIRPTSDRLRESLFNVLGDRVIGSVWLDIFAGSGAVGIEALSRGAELVVFNDRSRAATDLVQKNLTVCKITKGFEIYQRDAFVLLRTVQMARPATILFLDPPYEFGRYVKLLEKACQSRALAPESLLILELFRKTTLDFIPSSLSLVRTIECGDSLQLLLRRQSITCAGSGTP